MKFTRLSLVAALAISSAFAGGDIAPVEPVAVEVEAAPESAFSISANMAITSNYVWRGQTQTSNAVAIQGGIDLGYNGFYLGTWLSNVDFGPDDGYSVEADFYAGYAGEIAGIGFDMGYIQYAFPSSGQDNNADEAYLGLSKDFGAFGLSAKYSYSLDDDFLTDYWEVGASAKLPMDVTLAVNYGDQEDWGTNYLVSLAKEFGKFEVSVAYTDFSSDIIGMDDEDHIVGTISTSF